MKYFSISHFRATRRPLIVCLGTLLTLTTAAYAVVRPGAPRALRLEWRNETTPGSLLLPPGDEAIAQHAIFAAISTKRSASSEPPPIFFCGESAGTRNIWQATPEGGNFDFADFKVGQWSAHAITHLTAPSWADDPSPTNDGRSLLYTTNANFSKTPSLQSTNYSQIVRLDLQSGRTTSLTEGQSHNHSPAIAPDGSRFAFISDRGGLESLYVMPIGGGLARRLVSMAENPCWQDENTLLFRSTRAGQEGLYRLTLDENGAPSRPTLLVRNGSQATVSPDRRLLCAVIQTNSRNASTTQLCTLAPDGSGVQTLTGTEGAHSPQFSANGAAVVFDAPLNGNEKQRSLWLLPMLRSLPIAQLREVRPIRNTRMDNSLGGAVAPEAEIIGTAFAEALGTVTTKVEIGEGTEPRHWIQVPSRTAPIHGAALATWQPPLNARGDWTIRLTVTDASGDSAQSTLNITLPLEAPAPSPLTPFVFSNEPPALALASPTPLPTPTATPVPVPTKAPVSATPAYNSPGRTLRTARNNATPTRRNTTRSPAVRPGSTVPILPLPALPPAPGHDVEAPPTSGQQAVTDLPQFPVMTAPEATSPMDSPPPPLQFPSTPAPHNSSTRNSSTRNSSNGRAASGRSRRHSSSTRTTRPRNTTKMPPRPTTQDTTPSGNDRADIQIDGTPAELAVGERVEVRATLKNLGGTGWSSSGNNPVRLIYRWVDLKSGYRRRWAFQWLRSNVAPGATAQLTVSLTAPPYPGHYRLIYALIRVNGDSYTPPTATSTSEQVRWPGEFGGTAYIVDVR